MAGLAEFKEKLAGIEGVCVYEKSADLSGETAAAIVRKNGVKMLAVSGPEAGKFYGTEENGVVFAPLSTENAEPLQALFPYTAPKSHKAHPFTFGLGDRLGLATPGHVRVAREYKIFPIFAQQSIRELNLTNRTFKDVIAAAAFGVFQEGYKDGYGADGDHLKTIEEIRYALESGCSMVTLDCSEHIVSKAATQSDEEILVQYVLLPDAVRDHYEEVYLQNEQPIIGRLDPAELRRVVVEFWDAIEHAEKCIRFIDEIKTKDIDVELSIDETLSITTPAEHFVISNELYARGLQVISVAPHFNGEFEKGIDYAGDLNQFAADLTVHQKIADQFGYKLSLHSGSDKFTVFSTWGRMTKCRAHVKTAGTNWLEALKVVAKNDPELFRKTLKFAIEMRPEAEKYYHVSTDPRKIPNPDLQNDAYLPEYLVSPSSRQTLHITYGLLLAEDWFRGPFFKLMDEHEEDYYDFLEAHIGKHLRYLTAEREA